MKEFWPLFLLEIKLEWRNKFMISALFLFIISTVFICYLSFKQITSVPTWNALWWIILLFTVVQSASRSFLSETKGQRLYNYYTASPLAILFAKTFFVILLICIITIVGYVIYSLTMGSLVQLPFQFLLGSIVSNIALAVTFTFVSSIAAKSGNNATLMTILGLPVIIPILLLAIRITKNSADGITLADAPSYFIAQIAMLALVTALASILYPVLSKE